MNVLALKFDLKIRSFLFSPLRACFGLRAFACLNDALDLLSGPFVTICYQVHTQLPPYKLTTRLYSSVVTIPPVSLVPRFLFFHSIFFPSIGSSSQETIKRLPRAFSFSHHKSVPASSGSILFCLPSLVLEISRSSISIQISDPRTAK
jgi:hypothetical protein